MHPQTDNTSKVDWRIINWLRGLAAFYVTINHCRGLLFSDSMMYAEHVNPKSNWHWWEWLQVGIMHNTALGSEFVILFFLLSGFSIAHSLRSNTDTKAFYTKRLIRLYPTYLLGILWSLVGFFLIWSLVPQVYYNPTEGFPSVQEYFHSFVNLPTLIANFFYIPKNTFLTHQYWSLPFEVIFYLMAPWVIRRLRVFGIVVLTTYALGWFFYGISYHDPHVTNAIFQFWVDFGVYFLIGMIFYKYKDTFIRSFKLGPKTTSILLLVMFQVMLLVKGYYFGGQNNKVTGIMAVVFTYIAMFGALKYKFRVKWLETIGNYSYTLYVTHLATIFIVKILAYKLGYNFYFIHSMYLWYVGLVACMGVAYALYFVAERPSSLYLERLRKNPDVFSGSKFFEPILSYFKKARLPENKRRFKRDVALRGSNEKTVNA